ncbi:caspase-8 [Echeneis naucrates]|uniref:caspase-8 n=1 Tax=Echeneis naucrates TaxID=173247 RepID=UPI001113A84D|nr:caspase-8-like [Echeneis naucrates]
MDQRDFSQIDAEDVSNQKMEFQKLLLEVGKALEKDEVKALAFLCTDLLGQNPKAMECANYLFCRLRDQDHLSVHQPHLLTELLLTIKRKHLVRKFGLTFDGATTCRLISPYRKLLYNLSEEITDKELEQVKFLLNAILPRRKLEENVSLLDIFLDMEHMDLLSDTNLDELEKVIETVCPMLRENIKKFKARPVCETSPTAGQMCPSGSPTYSFELSTNPESLNHERTATGQRSESQSLSERFFNSSSVSVDLPDVLHAGESERALSQSRPCVGTNKRAPVEARRDNLGLLLSQENESSLENQFQAANTKNEDLGQYPMTAATRGICLIVNNQDFSKSCLRQREGTMIDERCLTDVFRWLGFEVEIRMDCTNAQILSAFQELGRKDHSQMDCVVCCVLSHGDDGVVLGVEGQPVKLRDLMEPLNGLNCPSLVEKPKLFFIQACQGNNEQRAVYIEADGSACDSVCRDAVVANDSIPADADFLLAMSTLPSFVSYREKTNGTWFVQSLCQNLVQMVPKGYDLISILTKVNADVSRRTDLGHKKKQMPQPAFSLRKKVVFPVPEGSPHSLTETSNVP